MTGFATTTESPVGMIVVYDLSVPGAWEAACQHAMWWGRLYANLACLGADRITVTFRPAPDERWREWERCRAGWIMRDLKGRGLPDLLRGKPAPKGAALEPCRPVLALVNVDAVCQHPSTLGLLAHALHAPPSVIEDRGTPAAER